MRTSVTVLENNMVQLIVSVEDAEFAEAMDATLTKFSRDIAIKGFRKGKAPKKLVEARIGGPLAMRSETIRESVPDFYAKAVSESMIDPIGQPTISITDGENEGELVFEALVPVRPEVDIAGHRDLVVTIPSPLVDDDEIEDQITRLRDTDAVLNDVDRPIVTGDVVIVDVKGVDPAGEEDDMVVDDYSFLVGSASIAEGVDETIIGLRAGETLEATGRKSATQILNFEISIKQVRERILPELTNEWVEENTEYATVEAMREGILTQLRRRKLVEAQFARREAAMLALSDLVQSDQAPEELVQREVEQRLADLSQRLTDQGVNFDYFMRVTNQSPEQLVQALREESERAVRVDLALRALARVEGLEPTAEEFDKELEVTAGAMEVESAALLTNLRENGRTQAFASEIAKMNASKWLLENVTYVDANGGVIEKSLLQSDQSGDEDA